MQTKTLQRLENTLSHWEQYCDITYLSALLSRHSNGAYQFPIPIDGPLGHSRTLRRHINSSEEFDYKQYVFGTKPDFYPKWKQRVGALTTFPVALFDWCKCSRRVYRITEELTHLLRMTKVDDVQWCDLRFPFSAFILELETGFVDSDGCIHNFFMVDMCIDNGKKKLIIMSIARKQGEFKIFPVNRFVEVRQLINNGKFDQAHARIARIADESDCACSTFVAPFEIDDEEKMTVGDSIAVLDLTPQSETMAKKEGFQEAVTNIAEQALRIICGFALYLKTLPPGSPHLGAWHQITASSKCGKVIGEGAQICEVSSSVKLSGSETASLREHFSKPCGYEMPAHFREGHWRRPPGKGTDPLAEKTVWVRPCIVRKDLMTEGTLPVGSLQTVK